MADITAIGDINVDIITSPIHDYPLKDSQLAVSDCTMKIGGSTAIFAAASAQLGSSVQFIGVIGDDALGDFVLGKLEDYGVKEEIKRVHEKTGVTVAINFFDGTRSMITFRGTNAVLDYEDIDLGKIRSKVLHIGGYNLLDRLRPSVPLLFDMAHEKKMITSLDPNWDPHGWTEDRMEQLKRALEKTDIFLPDYDEGRAITGKIKPESILAELLKMGPKVIALKCGSDGSYVGTKNGITYQPPVKCEAKNTTGAGDVYDAVFIKCYTDKMDASQCAKIANTAAAFYCEEMKYPTNEDIKY